MFKCFNCLPVAAIIEKKIFCCHGGNVLFFLYFDISIFSEGLSPDLHNLDQIRQIQRPTDVPENGKIILSITEQINKLLPTLIRSSQ